MEMTGILCLALAAAAAFTVASRIDDFAIIPANSIAAAITALSRRFFMGCFAPINSTSFQSDIGMVLQKRTYPKPPWTNAVLSPFLGAVVILLLQRVIRNFIVHLPLWDCNAIKQKSAKKSPPFEKGGRKLFNLQGDSMTQCHTISLHRQQNCL